MLAMYEIYLMSKKYGYLRNRMLIVTPVAIFVLEYFGTYLKPSVIRGFFGWNR